MLESILEGMFTSLLNYITTSPVGEIDFILAFNSLSTGLDITYSGGIYTSSGKTVIVNW